MSAEPGPGEAESVTRHILRETTVFAALGILSGVLRWVGSVILARLLERRDFGVFGICSFYIGLGGLLGNGGLGATLLRRKGDVTNDEYRVTVTALVAVAAVLAVALTAAAPWIGAYNHLSTEETTVLQVMAPVYLVSALRVVPYVRLERQLLFSTIARIELLSTLVQHACALTLAVLAGSVWALVVSHLAGAVVQLGLAYRASPGWVGLGWSWRVFRPLIAYGSKVQALSIFAYLKDNSSRALLGHWAGPTAVGTFDFGVSYIQTPVAAVNGLSRVQLPVYARLEAQDPSLYSTLRGGMRTALLVGIPLLCVLALLAPWLIPFIYGEKWKAAYPVVWGLLVNMVCGLVASPLFTLLQGQGRAGLAVIVFTLWTGATWLLALLAISVSADALALIACAYSVATVGVTAYLLVWATRHLKRSAFSGLGGPVLSGALGLAAAGALAWRVGGVFVHPVATAAVFLVTYVAVLAMKEGQLVLSEAQAIIGSIRRKKPS
ncbi:MAG: oligosaccharide flippase family protein [Chromatiales bacterium]